MSSEDGYETREEAWAALQDALSTMLDAPKALWPEGIEMQRFEAEEYLRDNPPTPATQVTMRLSRESLGEIVDAVVASVQDVMQGGISSPQTAQEVVEVAADVDSAPLHAETVLEFSDDSSEGATDHLCRANLDVDDCCTICGKIYVTGARVPLADGQTA